MTHCSPHDLVQLQTTSRSLHAFLNTHKHLWTAAQGNVGLPPVPIVEAGGNRTSAACAIFIFGGGACTWCSKFTPAQPFSFVFRFRACSPSCLKLLLSDVSLYVDKSKTYEDFSWGRWLPRSKLHSPFNVYSKRDIKYAGRERQQAIGIDNHSSRRDPLGIPHRTVAQLNEVCLKRARSRDALTEHALRLVSWQTEYFKLKATVSRANYDFIKLMSAVEGKKAQGILRTPKGTALFQAFNRDLTKLTFTVWLENRALLFAQLGCMLDGVFPVGTVGRPNDKLRCPYCPRLIKVKGMADHVVDKHPDHDPDTIPFIQKRDKKHCSECPSSKRLYTKRGLKDHKLNKHSTTLLSKE
ncbi:hypothetical protein B0H16DRAFT_1692545 [Mycena metata]|uniref:Uncharacterized protein n=1 Tax=Mycena metata TaxID=1033252 RepID=A0AAD7IN57_9AGAR|nr:hypothetical protein B0H16DRAFT_1692545 [Mycena metata]